MILFLENIAEGKRGGEVYLGHLFNFIKKRYKDVHPGNLEKFPPNLRNPLRHMFVKKKTVEQYQPDLVIVDISSAFRNFLAAYSMKKKKIAMAVVVQEERQDFRYNLFFMKWLVRRFERYLLKSASLVIANSKYIADRSKRCIRKGIPVIIAYPGLELNVNLYSQNNSVIGSTKQPSELLFVGQCAYRKGLKYLVEAIKYLNDIDVKLNITGDYYESDHYYIEIRQIIKQNNLEGRITFHGYLDRQKIDSMYKKNNIFVIPSLAEGYGMALAEALCYGLPVVASRVGAIPEMVKDGINAILVQPGNPRELAAGIRRLCQDSDLRNKMSQANIERAKTLPTWDDFCKTLDNQLVPVIQKELGNNV